MAKAITYDDEETIIEGQSTDLTDIQDNIDEELNRICSEIDDDTGDVQFRIKVYRILKDKGERSWMFDALPSELPILPRLRDEYEGGAFETIVYKKNRIFKRRKILVEPPIKKPVQASPHASDIENVLKYVTSGMAQLAEAVKELKTQPATPPVDPMAQMKNMIEIMVMMKSLQPEPPKQTIDTMEVFTKGVEFAKELAINSDGEVSTGQMVLSAIQNLGKPLLEMASKIQSAPQAPQPPRQLAPRAAIPQPAVKSNPAPRLQPQPQPQTEQGEDMGFIANVIQSRLTKELPKLCDKARDGKSAELQAALLVEEIDPAYYELVGQFLLDDTWFDRLSVTEPRMKSHREWFEDMRMCVLEELGLVEVEEEIEGETPIENDVEAPVNGTEKDPEQH